MARPRISDDDAALMRRQYEGAARPTLEDLEERWGWSHGAIKAAILRAGGTMRAPGKERKYPPPAHLLMLQESGISRTDLAARYGAGISTIDGMLSRARRERRLAMLARVAASGPFGEARP